MREFEIQKDFFEFARGKKTSSDTSISIYKKLVFLRFFDVLSGCFPLLYEEISENRFNLLVEEFIEKNPKNPYIWNAPKDFSLFLNKTNKITKINEKKILLFELIQLRLLIAQHRVKPTVFSWKKRHKLSKTASLITLLNSKKPSIYITYQNPEDYEIYTMEITPFMRDLLQLFRHNSPLKALKIVSKRFSLSVKKSKEIAEEGLKLFAQKAILQ